MGEEIRIVEVPVKWAELHEKTGDEGVFLEQETKVRLTLNDESMGSKWD